MALHTVGRSTSLRPAEPPGGPGKNLRFDPDKNQNTVGYVKIVRYLCCPTDLSRRINMTTTILGTRLSLPGGTALPNRLAKAAMSEGLADADNHATPRLEALYRRWANSGAGLLFSGNFQVDRWHLERPSNVVLDDEADLPALAAVAAAGKAGGSHFWAQLSHTGRQVSDTINPAPLSPSSVAIDVPRGLGYSFAKPREMTEAGIDHTIRQFAFAAQFAQRAGVTRVQLVAAHVHLSLQFLIPASNRRTDRWGGPL